MTALTIPEARQHARPEIKVSSRDMLIVSGHVDLLERFAARP